VGTHAFLAQLVDVADHHDAIEHGLAEQGDEADGGRYRERDAGEQQGEDATDQCEGNVADDDQRVTEGLEGVEEQHEDHQYGKRHDQHQALHGALLVLEFPGPGDRVALRQLHVGRCLLHVGDDAAHVAVADEDADGDDALAGFAGDVHGAAAELEIDQRRERHLSPGGRRDQHFLQLVELARGFGQADDDAEMAVTFPQFGGGLAGEGRFDDVLDVHHVQAVAGSCGTVDFQTVLRQVAIAVDEGAHDTGHVADAVEDLPAFRTQCRHVVAEQLDDDLAVDLRDGFEDLVAYRLAEGRLDTRHVVQLVFHVADQLFLGHALAPGAVRFQVDQHFGHVDVLRVGAVFRAAALGDHRLDFGEVGDDAAQLAQFAACLIDGNRGRQGDVDPDRAFVEFRQELRTQFRHQGRGNGEGKQGGAQHLARVGQHPGEHRFVQAVQAVHQLGFLVRHVVAEGDLRQEGNQRQRQDQRGDQRGDDGVGHRGKDLALVALHGEDRQVSDDDDDHRENRRPADFDDRFVDGPDARPVIFQLAGFAEASEDVLDDDHRAIDDDAEVHGAQRQQVGRNADQAEADEGAEQGERDHGGDDAGGPQVGQEDVEHQHDQRRAFQQVAVDGFQGLADQPGAVVVGNQLHTGRQAAAVQLVHLRLQRIEHQGGVLVLAQQDDAGYHVVLVAVGVGIADDALGRDARLDHLGHVADTERRSVVFGDDDLADIGRAAQATNGTDQELLPALRHRAAAGIGVGPLQRAIELADGDLVVAQLGQVGIHFVLADRAAERDHVGNPWHLLELAQYRPILDGAQLAGLHARCVEPVAEDLASRRGRRRQFGFDARRQVEAAQAFLDQLPRHEQAGFLVEGDDDEGESELRVREHADRVRHAGQGDFERNGDLLLHFFRGAPGEEGDDRDLGVGDIREGLDRQAAEGGDAGADEKQQAEDDVQRLMQREVADALDHLAACFSAAPAGLKYLSRCRLPSATTLSPACKPSRMSTCPSRSMPASTACLR